MGEVDPKLGKLIKRKRLERKLTQERQLNWLAAIHSIIKTWKTAVECPAFRCSAVLCGHSTFPPMITYTLIKTAAFLFISLCFIF